jgi:hypothetical protein
MNVFKQLMAKAHIEIPPTYQGRMIDAGKKDMQELLFARNEKMVASTHLLTWFWCHT